MWVWSKLSSAIWEDAWQERFSGSGGAVITTIPGRKVQRVEVYCPSHAKARKIQAQFGGSLRELRTQNWAALQPARLPAVKVRDRLLISDDASPAAMRKLAAQHPGRGIISIPPHLAFGTGHHATTATVLRLLVDYAEARAGQPWKHLDLGTGSGLLAIAAAKLGAQEVWGCDNDAMAVRVAKANVVRNKVPQVDMAEADVLRWRSRRRWDCVTANLFSSILEQIFPTIVHALKPDGVLLISGLLKTQAPECLAAAEAAGLRFDKVTKLGKWVTARGALCQP